MCRAAEFANYLKGTVHESLDAPRRGAGGLVGAARGRRSAARACRPQPRRIRSRRWRAPRACISARRSARARLADTRYLDLIRAQCGLIVPENELKMPAIQPQPGEFHFERADALLAFAETNDLRDARPLPAVASPALAAALAGRLRLRPRTRRRAPRALLRDHIARTTTRYGKRIVSWDVVNEAVDNVTGEMRETPLSKAIGSPDQVLEIAFHAARANLPDTELVYNDYMGWESDNAPHRDGVLRLLERFRKNGVPVNALGMQSHIGAGNQDSNANRAFDARDEKAWRKFLDEVTGMGYWTADHRVRRARRAAARGLRAARSRRGGAGSRLPRPHAVVHAGERAAVLGTDGHAHLAAGSHAARGRPAQAADALR